MSSATSSAASSTGSYHGDTISGNGSGNAKTLQWVLIAAALVAVVWLISARKK